MAVEYPGNIMVSPGYTKSGSTVDDELLYSTVGFTQKGVTLKAGQGVLLLGTVLAQNSTDKKWYAYANAGANGTGTPRGFLRQTVNLGVDAAGPDFQGNIVIGGILKLSKITAAGNMDGAAVTALNGRSDTVMDTFKF